MLPPAPLPTSKMQAPETSLMQSRYYLLLRPAHVEERACEGLSRWYSENISLPLLAEIVRIRFITRQG